MKPRHFLWLPVFLALAVAVGSATQFGGGRRGNLDLVLVRDASGSVKKYDHQMDEIIARTLAKLDGGDVVIPMQYATWASVLKDQEGRELILGIRGQKDKERLLATYKTIRSEGQWTYFRRAIQTAVERLIRFRREHPSNATPIILLITDGLSDTPESESDLDPQTLSRLFRRPEPKEFKLHVIQVGEDVQGRSTTKAVAHRLNLQVVTVANTPNLPKVADTAIDNILRQARSGRPGSSTGLVAGVAGWIRNVQVRVPAKKVGLVALSVVLILGGIWAAYLFKKQGDPFAVPEQDELKLQACILVRQEGRPASEHLFNLSDGEKEVSVGSSLQADVAIENDEGVLSKHLLLRLSKTGEVLMKFAKKRGRAGSWQRLDEGEPVELSPQTSVMVAVQEEPAHALFLFEDEAL